MIKNSKNKIKKSPFEKTDVQPSESSLFKDPALPNETREALQTFSVNLYERIREEAKSPIIFEWKLSKSGFVLMDFQLKVPTSHIEEWLEQKWVMPFKEAQKLPIRHLLALRKSTLDKTQYVMYYRLRDIEDLKPQEIEYCRSFVTRHIKLAPDLMAKIKEDRFKDRLHQKVPQEERDVEHAQMLGEFIVGQLNPVYCNVRTKTLSKLHVHVERERERIQTILSMDFSGTDYSSLEFEQRGEIFTVREFGGLPF